MSDVNFKDKSILIIGASGGLGKETTKHLIKDGATNVVMAGRSLQRVIDAKNDILSKIASQTQVHTVGGFDMLDPHKIHKAVSDLQDLGPFDVVFLGAGGVFFTEEYQTKEWKGKQIEKTVFQNLFGSHVVLQSLKREKLLSDNPRIIIAGGEGARGIPGMIKSPSFTTKKEMRAYIFDIKNIGKKYNPMDAIGVSKLFGALWISKLATLESENYTAIWFTPGLTSGTNGLAGLPPVKRWFMKHVLFGLMNLIGKAQSPEKGGRKFANCIEGKIGKNGDILGAPQGQALGKITDQKPMNPAFTNQELIEEIWQIMEELFGKF